MILLSYLECTKVSGWGVRTWAVMSGGSGILLVAWHDIFVSGCVGWEAVRGDVGSGG